MRWTVEKSLDYYSKLDPGALDSEAHNIKFRGYDKCGIPEFETNDGSAIVDFMESLDETTYIKNPKDDYQYKDHSVARFVRYRRCFDIKKDRKVIGRVYLSEP